MFLFTRLTSGAPPVVIVHNQCPSMAGPTQVSANVSLDSKMQVITLNNEADYPDGSWLGDETNPECRVRVPISPFKSHQIWATSSNFFISSVSVFVN